MNIINSMPFAWNGPNYWQQALDYTIDRSQRAVLFNDVMRQRANIKLEHEAKGKPPLLAFEYEVLLEGRDLSPPCNYMLLKILPPVGVTIDETKRPFIVVDPRAGHGAGIGGFKPDSQVGVALAAGHPVYFIGFHPDPVPGQHLRDVMLAESHFIAEVTRRHPQAIGKPCIIGNCQAGWAVAALAAFSPELTGPIILNGAPLSYWAGSDKQNPMRYSGGVYGGSWMAALAADLGGGTFDGAYLVENFENLNPANTLWGKPYHLFANIDTEAPRYLDFERWWGGHFRMAADEIDAIVNQLFIGNKLTQGGITLPDGGKLDLHNITAPIVVFASWGDDITPPAQALNWIIDLYGHESAIVNEGQVIVYLLHEDVGHLGIFVGGKVARKQHAELVDTIEMIESLPAGLYEMVIDQKSADTAKAALEQREYSVRFETRTIDDLRQLDPDTRSDEAVFSTVAQVSQINDAMYKATIRPALQALITPAVAELSRQFDTETVQTKLTSDLNPAMQVLAEQAQWIKAHRQPVAQDNFFVGLEAKCSDWIVESLNQYRDLRDLAAANYVKLLYGPLGWGAWFPPEKPAELQAIAQAEQQEQILSVALKDQFTAAGFANGLARTFLLAMHHNGAIERRTFLLRDAMQPQLAQLDISSAQWRAALELQNQLLMLDLAQAKATLPQLFKTVTERRKALTLIAKLTELEPELQNPASPLAAQAKQLLGIPEPKPRTKSRPVVKA